MKNRIIYRYHELKKEWLTPELNQWRRVGILIGQVGFLLIGIIGFIYFLVVAETLDREIIRLFSILTAISSIVQILLFWYLYKSNTAPAYVRFAITIWAFVYSLWLIASTAIMAFT